MTIPRIFIAGVPFDSVSQQSFEQSLENFFGQPRFHLVVTPNAEFVVEAQKNTAFRNVLRSADLAPTDGVGPQYAAWLYGRRLQRFTGSQAVESLCTFAEARKLSIMCIGGATGVAEKASQTLRTRHPQLTVAGAISGGQIDDPVAPTPELINQIQKAAPDILLVAFGHPKQELWLWHHREQLRAVRIGIGVGGVFDYLAGVVAKPPALIQTLGLETFFRLITQPWRARRIFTALVVFPLTAFWYRATHITR